MGLIVNASDFGKGKHELSNGTFQAAAIDAYIEKYEAQYLADLLGADLSSDFINDLTGGAPTAARFVKIFDPLFVDRPACVIKSEGIKEMLKGFIYFEYAKDLTNKMTPQGNTLPANENADRATTLYTTFYNRYNEAVRSFRTIQQYICLNPEGFDYDKFNGNPKQFATWL